MAVLRTFPYITELEFVEGCKAIEDRSSDKLDGTDWLSVRSTDQELVIKQTRKIQSDGQRVADTAENEECTELLEDSCHEETLIPFDGHVASLIVDYSITLSPTYGVPVLWFSYQGGSDRSTVSLDRVYEWLVPQQSHTPMRSVGVMGAVTMAYHPVADQPAYFVHPCNTPEALLALKPDKSLTPEEYMLLWLGLIGSSVGLHVPRQVRYWDIGSSETTKWQPGRAEDVAQVQRMIWSRSLTIPS